MAERRWSCLLALLAGSTLLAAACVGGEATSTEGASSDTESETDTNSEAATGDQSDGEVETGARVVGVECLIGKWEAHELAMEDSAEEMAAAWDDDPTAPELEVSIDGGLTIEFRADGTLTSVIEHAVVVHADEEVAVVSGGTTTVEAGWTVDGSEITITVNDLEVNMDALIANPKYKGARMFPGVGVPERQGESNTATFDCSGDTLTTQSRLLALRIGADMTRVG